MSNQEIIAKAISKLRDEEKAAIYPPLFRKNFVVRKGWMGRNQVITFDTKPTKTKPSVRVTYNHDDVLEAMLPRLNLMPCWAKREYWSQSTDMPSTVKHLGQREAIEAIEAEVTEK